MVDERLFNAILNVYTIFQLSVSLDWAFCSIRAFCVFLVGHMGTVHEPPNSAKRRFLGKFGSHGTIHTFKNYFAIVFPTISFQFSANKRYPNTPLMAGVQNYYFD